MEVSRGQSIRACERMVGTFKGQLSRWNYCWVRWTSRGSGWLARCFHGDELDYAGEPDVPIRACCGRRLGWTWTESGCAAGTEERELDEGYLDLLQKRRPAGVIPVGEGVLGGKIVHDTSKAMKVCRVQDWCCLLQWIAAVECWINCTVGARRELEHQRECRGSFYSTNVYACNGQNRSKEQEGDASGPAGLLPTQYFLVHVVNFLSNHFEDPSLLQVGTRLTAMK